MVLEKIHHPAAVLDLDQVTAAEDPTECEMIEISFDKRTGRTATLHDVEEGLIALFHSQLCRITQKLIEGTLAGFLVREYKIPF
jgi:hypothetical protein